MNELNIFLNWLDIWARMKYEIDAMGAGGAERVQLPDHTYKFLATHFEPCVSVEPGALGGTVFREALELNEWRYCDLATEVGYSIFMAYFEAGNKLYWSLGERWAWSRYSGWERVRE